MSSTHVSLSKVTIQANQTNQPWISIIFKFIKDFAVYRGSREFWWPFSSLVVWSASAKGVASNLQHADFSYAKARERIAQGSTDRADFMSYMLKHNDEKG